MKNDFLDGRDDKIREMVSDSNLELLSDLWMNSARKYGYIYNFSWFGDTILQFPNDILLFQELIYKSRPELIIETGVARVGSASFFSSILALLDLEDMSISGTFQQKRRYLGIDLDIREHAQVSLTQKPLLKLYARTIEGSSTSESIFRQVQEESSEFNQTLIVLDSDHSFDHVFKELSLYSQLIKQGGFLVVCDTSIDWDGPQVWEGKRNWGPGNNPMTALTAFLETNQNFVMRNDLSDKILISSNRHGVLQRVSI